MPLINRDEMDPRVSKSARLRRRAFSAHILWTGFNRGRVRSSGGQLKLMGVLLALLCSTTAFASEQIMNGEGVGFDRSHADACHAAEMDAVRQIFEQQQFLDRTGQRKSQGWLEDCRCEGPSSRRTDYKCIAKWRLD